MAESFLKNLGNLTDHTKDLSKAAVVDLGKPAGMQITRHAVLDAMCDAVARSLHREGLRRGDRVAILSANRVEYLAAYLGIMRAGFVAVPANYRTPQATIDHIFRDSGARLAFCDDERVANVPSGVKVVNFDHAGPGGFAAWLDHGPFASVVPQDREAAMFLYTSGSTGFPKGVVLSHQSHLWVTSKRIKASNFEPHRVLVAAPLCHMNGLSTSAAGLAGHATIVLIPRFVTKDYIAAIGTQDCTWLTGVPPMMAMVLQEKDALRAVDTSRVKFIRMGSAPLSQEIAVGTQQNFPNASLMNVYGSTEAGPVIFGAHPDRIAQPPTSVGARHPEMSIRLVDGDNLDADQGELQVKGPGLMNGYHNLPDTTAAVMTRDGYYQSGDLMRRDRDGFYYFVGRVDDMFVSGGENVFPRQVEIVLEQYPGVAQSCVVPVPDPIKGTKPFAFVVLRAGASVTADALKAHSLENGPAYQHPRHIQFLPELPVSGPGKIDRRVLIERAARIAQET